MKEKAKEIKDGMKEKGKDIKDEMKDKSQQKAAGDVANSAQVQVIA